MVDGWEECGEVVKAGYLVKSPPPSRALVAQWHKRWFLLMDSKLVFPTAERYVRMDYYQSEADARRLADTKGTINLGSCVSVVPRTDSIKNFKHVFDVRTSDRVYHLSADSDHEKWAWISILNDLLFSSKLSNSPTADQRSPSSNRSPRAIEVMKKLHGLVVTPISSIRQHSSDSPSSREYESDSRGPSRPLPPVPADCVTTDSPPSPVEWKNRPLPSHPRMSSQQVGPHKAQVMSGIGRVPPSGKPPPYKAKVSQQFTPNSAIALHPSTSLVTPTCAQSVDYQEVPIEFSALPQSLPGMATSRLMGDSPAAVYSILGQDEYSVLTEVTVASSGPCGLDYYNVTPGSDDSSPPPPSSSRYPPPNIIPQDYLSTLNIANPTATKKSPPPPSSSRYPLPNIIPQDYLSTSNVVTPMARKSPHHKIQPQDWKRAPPHHNARSDYTNWPAASQEEDDYHHLGR